MKPCSELASPPPELRQSAIDTKNSPAATAHHEHSRARGMVYVVSAYVFWGLVPIFWKLFHGIAAIEVIAHRVVWSLVFVVAVGSATGLWTELKPALRSPQKLGLHALSGLLLAGNWLAFVWGVNHGRVLETSLGYFLVPLGSVALGRLLLGERLDGRQWWAIALAGVGVALQFRGVGGVPWVALAILVTWSSYGYLRKRSPLGSLAGLALETTLLGPIGAGYLLFLATQGRGALGHASLGEQFGLVAGGMVTTIPLLLFAAGARRLPLTTVGLLQYIVPSMTFLLGAFLYHEPLAPVRLVSFVFIWAALALYSLDAFARRR